MLIDYCYVTNNTTLSHIGDEENLKRTMATSYRKLDFDPASGEDWTQYVEWMEYYFLVNGITSADKQRAVLISAMGEQKLKLQDFTKSYHSSQPQWQVIQASRWGHDEAFLSAAIRNRTDWDLNSIHEQGNQANLWPITLRSYERYPIIVILAILSS